MDKDGNYTMILMKNFLLKCSIFIISLLLFPLLVNAEKPKDKKWEMLINLDKQEFLLHEILLLDVTITNITSDTLKNDCIVFPNHYGFSFIIKDSQGDTLEYDGLVLSSLSKIKTYLIEPGGQIYRSFNLLYLYSPLNHNTSSYSIQANINLGYENKYLFDDLTSNEISFSIIDPSGDEKEALELLIKARKLSTARETMPDGVPIYNEILNKYPNSVYSEESYRGSLRYTKKSVDAITSGTFDSITFNLKMINNFPNSGTTRGWLQGLSKRLKEEKMNEILNKVIKDYPNSRAAKYANQMLNPRKEELKPEMVGKL